MTIGTLLLAAGIVSIAFAIVTLNDKTKRDLNAKKQAAHPPGSTLGLVLGFVVLGIAIGLGIAARQMPWLGSVIPLAILGLVLVVLAISLRKLLWAFLRAALRGKLPHVITKNADGEMEMKCPSCSGKVVLTPGEAGETAFNCPHCGENAAWTSSSIEP